MDPLKHQPGPSAWIGPLAATAAAGACAAVVLADPLGFRHDPTHAGALALATLGVGALAGILLVRSSTQPRAPGAASLGRLVESCPGATLVVDAAGRVTHASAEALDLFGRTTAELVGHGVHAVLGFTPASSPDHDGDVLALLRQHARQHAAGERIALAARTRDRGEIDVDVAVRLHGADTDAALVCTLADATAQRQRVEAATAVAEQLRVRLVDTEQRAAQLRSLTSLGELLQSCNDEREACAVAAHGGARLFPQLSGALYFVGEDRDEAALASTWGPLAAAGAASFAPGGCWALRRGRLHHADGPDAHPRCEHVSEATPSYACVPVQAHGETIGVLTLSTAASDALADALSPAQQLVVTALAEQSGLAVANLRLREALRAQSIRDPLTGLYNRRFLDEWLERELLRARRQGETVSVLMLDIDHFKRFNDSYGHESGDAALREVGALLLGSVRATDVACRLGGEELALLLPNTSKDGAETLAEKLRAAVEELVILCRGQSLGRVTVSIGVATYPHDGSAADDVLHAADIALYRAKDEGRNRVRVARPEAKPGVGA